MNKTNLCSPPKIGAFSLLFAGVFLFLLHYNILSISILEKKISIKYQEIVDITKRFHSYYINANEIQLNKGIHEINNVGIIVNQTGRVKVLSPAIELLHQSLSEVFNSKYLWTIAVIEKLHDEHRGNSYFKPLRENYITFNDQSLDDLLMLDRIVKIENLEKNYRGFHDDDIRLTEVYEEQWTNERINSIIYPIYLNTKLVSLIIIDIKEGMNGCIINEINKNKWIFIDDHSGLSWFTFNVKLPYTVNDTTLNVSINVIKIFLVSLVISMAITFIACSLYFCYLKIDMVRRCDRMTTFYRRDFYESELKQLKCTHVLMIDIDHFKNVNDKHGHEVGDHVIKQVTRRIRERIRTEDIAIRWGGEEFVLIFSHISTIDFVKKAEQLRLYIASELIENMVVTISLGGSVQQEFESVGDTIKRADVALYQSKNAGRNRVTMYKNEHEEE